MASSHSSSPVPQGSSSDVFFKKEVDPTKHVRPVQSLPDVCPKEPTVTDQHRWTVYHSKVNLPAALNDPTLAKRESDFFTKTWGLGFVDTEVIPSLYLPQISKEHFIAYQQEISQREKIHERCKNICPPKDTFDRTLLHIHDKSRTDLEQVPKIFMKPDFALDDSLTFNSVLPWSHFNTAGGKGNRDAASSKLLQEKLSHYLDIVEVNIAHQISLRSEAFFHAMTSQHELQDYLKKTSQAVKMLRDKIAQIDKVMCEGSLQILRLALTRNNCVKVSNKLKLMATVHQTQPTVQVLLSTSEFVGALDLIATTQEVLQQELQGVHSFRHLGSQLCELEKLIDKMMIAEFSTYSHSDLNRPLEGECQVLEEERLVSLVFGLLEQRKLNFLEIYGEETIITAKNIIKECVINKVAQVEEIDTDAVVKLADQMRMLNFPQWIDLLKDIFSKFTIFLQRVKATLNVIHSVVLSVLDKNQRTRELEEVSQQRSAGKDNSLDTEVAYLTHEGLFISDAFSEAEPASAAVDTTSQRNTSPHSEPCSSDSVSEPECTTDSSSSKEQTPASATLGGVDIIVSEDMRLTDLELGKLASNIQELLCNASDVCHDRAVKFLMSRAKDGFLEKLNSTEFIALSRLMETYIVDTEQICGRKSTSLLGALQSQANKFVNRFHEERRTKLSLLLDNERWKQADVPAEFQDLVDSIADGKIALPDKKPAATEDRKPADVLVVEGHQYAVVGTVLLLIRIILEYCQCVDNIPSVTTDMLTRLTDLLKYFNSRSCQLVLGAGALQVVGLKTITTKNLALSSRCLQLIVHYIPVIRAHFEARLPRKQWSLLRHFDHITKDYHDHIGEISSKLIAIMDSLFDKLLSRCEVEAPAPSPCFRNICKQMTKMHEAIFDLLPKEQTQMLILRINASYKFHLKKQLSHLNVINDGGPQSGFVTADVAFYTGNLQALKGLKDLDLNMAEIWEQKR
uniref:Vacuolar protein sorting-associated protein 54 n=1 Tax=Rattus norvegicus TaxID=10116 RepID=VPS54_RAT|nr:RecName: Full=Vacuolar protein sorting-associated protein 54; AltName: Full=Vps54-like protein [Rattus norvegicus]CAB96885.1 Vps54l-like protein [Rattus norvegicus]|eukprot:NP_775170.1 vacuolar protein sorting-associated protein 54 [Rattus norvegicus]